MYPLDLHHMTYRQHLILGVTTTILILAILSYALRLYAKRITAANVWWDDYTIGVGLVCANVVSCHFCVIFGPIAGGIEDDMPMTVVADYCCRPSLQYPV